MQENKIPAVFKEDLRKVLESIGELPFIEEAQRNCVICSKGITIENIQLIIPRSGNKFEYVCDDPQCIAEFNSQTPKA